MAIKFSDVDFNLLQVYYHYNYALLRYNDINDKPLYIQTCLFNEYSIPSRINLSGLELFKNISDRSYVKTKMSPDMDIYHFYLNLDNYLGSYQFKTKLVGNNNFEYEPIIKNFNNDITLKYYLPHQKIRIGYPEDIDSNDHDTKMRAVFISNDDDFFEYVKFQYTLHRKINNISQTINFETFDQFTTYMKEGSTVKFIVRPTLLFKDKLGFVNTKIYYIRMDVVKLEIGNN
jgi:hypothetical protein